MKPGRTTGGKTMLRTTLAVLADAVAVDQPRQAQSAWTGGDDLPTNPLACDGTPGTVGGQGL